MRLFLRILGTWLLGLSVIFMVIDGTRSLAANALITTPLVDTWSGLNAQSMEAVRSFVSTRFFSALLQPAFEALLGLPSFVVIGVPALVFVLLGRSRTRRQYVRQDQI